MRNWRFFVQGHTRYTLGVGIDKVPKDNNIVKVIPDSDHNFSTRRLDMLTTAENGFKESGVLGKNSLKKTLLVVAFAVNGVVPTCSSSLLGGTKYICKQNNESRKYALPRRTCPAVVNPSVLKCCSFSEEVETRHDKGGLEPPEENEKPEQVYLSPSGIFSPRVDVDDFGVAVERAVLSLRTKLERQDFEKIFDRKNPLIGDF